MVEGKQTLANTQVLVERWRELARHGHGKSSHLAEACDLIAAYDSALTAVRVRLAEARELIDAAISQTFGG